MTVPALSADCLQDHTITTVESIARDAGRILLEGWSRRPDIEYKTLQRDIVTEFDRRAEAHIVRALRAAFPMDSIVGEEGSSFDAGSDSAVWYVDPIDGTLNFSHGLPLFSISIGRCRRGVPELGVVHAPAIGWTFSGVAAEGAYRSGTRIGPSQVGQLDCALVVTGFPEPICARGDNTQAFLAFNQIAGGLRGMGSTALDLCFVACGWLDGAWQRNIKAWDVAAGAAILRAAGGMVTDLDGGQFNPTSGRILASNGRIHAEMQRLLARAG